MWFTCRITKTSIQTRTQNNNMEISLLFRSNSGYVKAPQYYIVRTLPVLLIGQFEHFAQLS